MLDVMNAPPTPEAWATQTAAGSEYESLAFVLGEHVPAGGELLWGACVIDNGCPMRGVGNAGTDAEESTLGIHCVTCRKLTFVLQASLLGSTGAS
jgi:hypothetical protein